MQDWIDKYPGVKRLLQDNAELLYDVDGAQASGGDGPEAAAVRARSRAALRVLWNSPPAASEALAVRETAATCQRLKAMSHAPIACRGCRQPPCVYAGDGRGMWIVSCAACAVSTEGRDSIHPDPQQAAILQWNHLQGAPLAHLYFALVLGLP